MAIAVYFINLFLQARHCYADLDQTKQRSENTIQLHNIKNKKKEDKKNPGNIQKPDPNFYLSCNLHWNKIYNHP